MPPSPAMPRLLAALLALSLVAIAEDVGMATLIEGGPLRLIRGATMMHAGEGVPLRRGDIIEIPNAGFAQLELAGGAVVALGPSTRVFLLRRDAAATELVVLEGWLKAEVG